MALIGYLNVLAALDTSKWSKGKKAFVADLKTIGSQFATTFVVGATAATAALTALTVSAMQGADDLAASAGLIGTTTKALSELHYAAKLSDVEVATLDASLKKLNVNLANAAATGKGGTAEALDQLGLSASKLATMDPSEALVTIADKLAGIDNPAQQAALAMDLFGKSGVEMVAFLAQGREGIEALRAEAERLGVSLDDVDAARINQANDAFDKIGAVAQGLGNELAIAVAPIITDLAERFLATGVSGQSMAKVITTGLEWIVGGIQVVLETVHFLHGGIKLLQLGFTQWIHNGLTLVIAFGQYFGKVIDWISMGTTSISQFANALEEELDRTESSLWTSIEQHGSSKAAAGLGKWFEDVKKKSAEMSPPVKKASADIESLVETKDKVAEASDKLIGKLQEEIDTFGMTSEQAELYKAKVAGVSDEVLKQAAAMQKRLDVMEATKKKQEELAASAKSVLESIATPQEQFAKEQKDLVELFNQGYLSMEQLKKANDKLHTDIFGEAEEKKAETKAQFSNPFEVGSVEGRNFLVEHKAGGSKRDPRAEEAKKAAEQRKRAEDLLKAIKKNTGNEVVVTRR